MADRPQRENRCEYSRHVIASLDEIQRRFPGAVTEAVVFRNQPSIILAKDSLLAVGQFLKSNEGGAYVFLTDETAVDYPKREKRFEIIYQLYSFRLNNRLRLKVVAGENERVPSVSGLWPTANWLEREVFDISPRIVKHPQGRSWKEVC